MATCMSVILLFALFAISSTQAENHCADVVRGCERKWFYEMIMKPAEGTPKGCSHYDQEGMKGLDSRYTACFGKCYTELTPAKPELGDPQHWPEESRIFYPYIKTMMECTYDQDNTCADFPLWAKCSKECDEVHGDVTKFCKD